MAKMEAERNQPPEGYSTENPLAAIRCKKKCAPKSTKGYPTESQPATEMPLTIPKSEEEWKQTPEGYSIENLQAADTGKNKCYPETKKKGERGFIEGCLYALCCCWLCEACF